MSVRCYMRRVWCGAGLCVCLVAVLTSGGIASAAPRAPSIAGASGGGGVPVVSGFSSFDPAVVGYRESEVILSGTANAYDMAASAGNDGKVTATVAGTAPYTTRAVVMRPADPRRFNGTVIVEWLNVSGGADAGADWMLGHTELIRDGFAWVGVSAQKVGVDALKSDPAPRGDPARYASLSHPGDDYSYDIFSQAGEAIRADPAKVLGGLRPRHLIGVGESQSAIRLVTYIDAVHPLAHVYDGFLVHSRAGGQPIRADLGVPVLVLLTETDLSFGAAAAQQPDTKMVRIWEAAGTSHYDYYGLAIQNADTGDGKGSEALLAAMQHPTSQPDTNFTCGTPINTGPAHYVLDAAFYQLNRWVTKKVLPPVAPRLQTTSDNPITFATDANGNTRGGIRTPAVDAPVAALSGRPPGGNSFCFLFGTTTPFTATQMAVLYPSHRAFVAAWTKATKSAHDAGFLTTGDAKELINAAVHSDIGK